MSELRTIWYGLIVKAKAALTGTQLGSLEVLNTNNKLHYHNGTTASAVVTEDHTATLTNKTINASNNTISNIPASSVVNTPSGNLAATDVQAALNELQTDIDTRALASDLTNHLSDAVDAHDASAISSVPSGNLAASDVQAALDELQSDIDTRALASDLSNHLSDAVDAHDASAISSVASGNLAATDVQGALNELQSDIDTRALSSDLSTHMSDTTTHGTTGDIVGTSDAQVLTNKDIDGGTASNTSRLTVPKAAKATLDGLTRKEGTLVYASDENKLYADDGAALVELGAGAAAGVTMTVTAGEALAANIPVYISQGTGNDSVRTAGRAYQVDPTNDDRIEFVGFTTASISSGATGSVQVAGELAGFTGLTTGEPIYATGVGTFGATAPSTVGQWAIQLGVATAATKVSINGAGSATATKLNDSPAVGLAGSEWTAYTLTIGTTSGTAPSKGTVVRDQARWRRVGDSMEIEWNYSQSAIGSDAGTTGHYLFPLPSGYLIDTNKIGLTLGEKDATGQCGEFSLSYAGTNVEHNGMIKAYDTSNLIAIWGSSYVGKQNNNAHITAQASLQYSFFARVPILGWSALTTAGVDWPRSTVRLSGGSGFGSTNTSVRRYTNTVENIGSALTLTQSATLGDSVTVNEAGIYAVSAMDYSDSGIGFAITKNSTVAFNSTSDSNLLIGTNASGTRFSCGGSFLFSVGDIIRVVSAGTGINGTNYYDVRFIITKVSN